MPQNWVFWRTLEFGPLNVNVVIHHRDPQKAHPCVNPCKNPCKNPLRGLTCSVSELTESVTDTHTHTGKFIFCPCIALGRQKAHFTSQLHYLWLSHKSITKTTRLLEDWVFNKLSAKRLCKNIKPFFFIKFYGCFRLRTLMSPWG